MLKQKQIPIILASSSPRRRELLEGLGLSFSIHPSQSDESVQPGTSPAELVEILSLRKARAVAKEYREGIVIGSDTIVVLNDQILGKPVDEDEAFSMLLQLQGNTHKVYTGVAVIDASSGEEIVAHQVTEVTIRNLSEEEILSYIATKEPMDKAGAYAIQGLGATLVSGINGDYFTVVGLPVGLLAQLLKHFGIDVLKT